MDRDALLQRLTEIFVSEAADHVRTINADLLEIERAAGAPPPPLVASLFRALHSVKGAARSVGLLPLERAFHVLEGVLGHVRDGSRPLDPTIVEALLAAADGLEEACGRLQRREDLAGCSLERLMPAFERLAAGETVEPGTFRGPVPTTGHGGATAGHVGAPAEPGALATGGGAPDARAMLRLDAGKVDALLARAGEVLAATREIEGRLAAASMEPAGRLSRAVGGLLRDVHALRMVPVAGAMAHLERVVRDVAIECGKEAALQVEGGDVELDRSLVDLLRDPLMHLVRNAVDHGLEAPEARVAAGKPRAGRIVVRARLQGDRISIAVGDDGRGLDRDALLERARSLGRAVADDATDVAGLAFLPGLSTARSVTEVSGRGVGLDVVKRSVERLGGSISVRSEAGRGAEFELNLPLTLSTGRVLQVACGGHQMAIPSSSIARLVRITDDTVRRMDGEDVVMDDGDPLRAAWLGLALGLEVMPQAVSTRRAHGVVVAAGARRVCLLVDELIVEREVVVKPLGRRVAGLASVAGATILEDGTVLSILSPAFLVRGPGGWAGRAASGTAPEAGVRRRRILVVDDSLTMRSLERGILESAGLDVLTAADGLEALAVLRSQGADLVVSDVEMPRMDGFELTATLRKSKEFAALPVILVTTLSSDEHRRRGIEAGADAYITKGTFERSELLATVEQLL